MKLNPPIMKRVFFILFAGALLSGCSAESLEDHNIYEVDKTKIQRPGSQGIMMEEVDKTKIERPGSQGGGN